MPTDYACTRTHRNYRWRVRIDLVAELPTEFEPSGRAPHDVLLRQLGKLSADALMKSVANSSQAYISILNPQRQVIFSNDAMVRESGFAADEMLGMRPGDVLSCRVSDDGPDGCGTAPACSTCGAAKVLRLARLGPGGEDECHIVQKSGEAIDLKVTASPFMLDDEQYYLFTAIDISDAKRREALERIFFHDIMNTATGVRGLSTLVRGAVTEDRDELLDMLEQISEHLIDEIQAQRDLLAAENGELDVKMEMVRLDEMIHEVVTLYEGHQVAEGKTIDVAEHTSVRFATDPALLGRVLGNLVKNALEASSAGDTVTISGRVVGANVVFSVANPASMSRDVQHQVFHRSFTTKGPGRGLGTYGARLLTERYLHGSVSFESTPQSGTVFQASLPLDPEGVSSSF